ncbi:hypothetical protein ACFQ2M_00580 [Kitasatospora saccharophila]|uniref:hypothetical protein n=1 Tax=Kitasatospora saccharophila TaxID=407973 RepID=UPI0031D6D32E
MDNPHPGHRPHLTLAVCGAIAPEPNPPYPPGRWMPHLGLTRRMEPDGLAPAHRLLGRRPDPEGVFGAARSFDGESQLTDPLVT